MTNEQTGIKRILVIQTAFLGDVIMSTPIFQGLKEIWPEVRIDVLVIPETASVLKNNPYIDDIYRFDKRKKKNKLKSILPLIMQLRKNRYDISFSIQTSLTSSLIMLLAGIKKRVGYRKQKLLTDRVILPKGLHIRDRVIKLIEPFGKGMSFSNETAVYCSDADVAKVKTLIDYRDGIKRISMAPGSVWATKKWPEHYFVDLLKQCGNYQIYFIGGADDYDLCARIIKQSGHKFAVNCAGKLSMLESCALIREMDLMICNDSAPLHMANAVKTDVFAFFGPTVKKFGCYPYRDGDIMLEQDIACRPCGKHGSNSCPEGHHRCMKDTSVEEVFKKIEIYFGNKYE